MYELILLLIDNLFPNIENENERVKNFLVESIRNTSNRKRWVEKYAQKREEKLYLFHLLKRLEILDYSYKLLTYVCKNNKKIQFLFSANLNNLTRYIGLLPSVSDCLITIISENEEILMQFSKLRTGEATNLDIKTYGFEFFE